MITIRRLFSALVSVVLAGLLVAACGDSGQGQFRYRLEFSVSLYGRIKSASSIIDVRYWGGGGSASPSAVMRFSEWKGIAPVVDLGPRGWLFAAMFDNNGPIAARHMDQSILQRATAGGKGGAS